MAVHLPKGTRDFLPSKMRNRLLIIARVREVFERFGFEPLETPAFERIETLTGKYGDEGSQLIYKILKRGAKADGTADLALRYDLTVPLARVVAMNPQLRMPFKRYQIQPVWRADRPAKGRFREFYQCDVDICGTVSPVADAECLAIVAAVLGALGFAEFTIRLNDRRILRALAVAAGAQGNEQETSVLVALDKLDKIGREGVEKELRERGFEDSERLRVFWDVLEPQDGNENTLSALSDKLGDAGAEGVSVLRQVLVAATAMGVPADRLKIDPTLARGLDYYTGPVFETVVTEPKIGSISGGGRYDGLIGMFSNTDVPSVGVSLGLERIIAVMEELGMLPETGAGATVFVTVFSDDAQGTSLQVATLLRNANIDTELWLGETASRKSMKKQMKYANAGGYPYVVVIGPDEAAAQQVTLKNMLTGEQDRLSHDELVAKLQLVRQRRSWCV